MDEYITALISRALIELSGDLAVKIDRDPDTLVEQALLDASLLIRRHGKDRVIASIRKHHPRLYDKAFSEDNGVAEL